MEDLEGYQKILNGKYRSQYNPQSLLGSLKTFEVRYNFSTVFYSSFSRPYVPAPTQEQIDQLMFLNKPENQNLLVKFVEEQRAGQNPTLPKPPGPDPNPY